MAHMSKCNLIQFAWLYDSAGKMPTCLLKIAKFETKMKKIVNRLTAVADAGVCNILPYFPSV